MIQLQDNYTPGTDIWRPIPHCRGYFVDPTGRILSTRRKRPRILRPWRQSAGYLQIDIAGRRMLVHRVVAAAWIGPPPDADSTVHHLDFTRTHNAAANLAWLSRSENSRIKRPRTASHTVH